APEGRQPHDRGVRRRVAGPERRAQGGHVRAGRQRGGQPAGEVDLVDVARRDRGPDGVGTGAERGAGERGGRLGPPAARPRPPGPGPCQGRPGHGRAGRDSANRASTGSPENGSTTAQSPSPSSAARSEVTSSSPVSTRPPTTASGAAVTAPP